MTLLLNAALKTVLRQNRKYIVIENSTSIDPSSILSLPQLRFTPDFVLAIKGENNSVSLWTHSFVGETVEEQNLPLLLDEWVDGEFKYGANLFPDKLSNFKGRKLSFATFDYPPYAIIGK